jgi:hypothetical protein
MDWQIISIATIDISPYIGTNEKALVEENTIILGFRIWCRSFCMEMMEMQIPDLPCICSFAKSLYQDMRNTGNTCQMNMVVRLDDFYSLIGGNEMYFFHISDDWSTKITTFSVILLFQINRQ